MELKEVEKEDVEKEESQPLKPIVEAEIKEKNMCDRRKAILGGSLGGGAIIIIIIVCVFTIPKNDTETQIWNGYCIECRNQICNPGEKGLSELCQFGTVSCINATGKDKNGNDWTRRHCGDLDIFPETLKMNGCVEVSGSYTCACNNTDDCNKDPE